MKKLLKYSLGLLVSCCVSSYAQDVTGSRLNIGTGHSLTGTDSTIAGGGNHEINGDYLAIGGGDWNTIANTNFTISYSVIAGGTGNIIDSMIAGIGGGAANSILSSDGSFIGGGENNIATNAPYSFIGSGGFNSTKAGATVIGGGQYNVAEGQLSTIPGGDGALASKYGQFAYAAGSFAGAYTIGGDAQTSIYVQRNSTTNSTQTELYLDGGANSERMTLSSGSSWTFDILIVGRNSTGDSAHYEVVGGIENVSGTTALVGTPIKTVLGEDVSGWDVTISADDTNDALRIQVTGDSSTIRWVATVRTVEVKN